MKDVHYDVVLADVHGDTIDTVGLINGEGPMDIACRALRDTPDAAEVQWLYIYRENENKPLRTFQRFEVKPFEEDY